MSEDESGGIAVDTSVIIAAVSSWHEHHSRAIPVVREALDTGRGALVPLPALVESFSVLTRLPPPWRLCPADARDLVVRTFRDQSTLVGLEGEDGWDRLDSATARGISGGTVHDAHIVACARKAGAEAVATFNRRHFERLDCAPMELIVP